MSCRTPFATALALVLLAGQATAQIERQGGRLVDTSKEPVLQTITDGTDLEAADRANILDTVAGILGEDAIRSNGINLPDEIEAAIVEGDPLPEGAEARPLSDELTAALAPWRPDDATWVQVGEHLIAADSEGTAIVILYDALN